MRLAVCLLTADRADYTCETLASFVDCADRPEFIRLHADDGSENLSNHRAAEAAGFETVYSSPVRQGPMAALQVMWLCAQVRGATHVLHLENDWQFQAGLILRDDVECMRLYGEFKARGGNRMPSGPHIMGTKERIQWERDTSGNGWGFERAAAHWGGPPSITRADILLPAMHRARAFKDLSMNMQRLDTVRPYRNVVWHIGEHRTPGAKFNA